MKVYHNTSLCPMCQGSGRSGKRFLEKNCWALQEKMVLFIHSCIRKKRCWQACLPTKEKRFGLKRRCAYATKNNLPTAQPTFSKLIASIQVPLCLLLPLLPGIATSFPSLLVSLLKRNSLENYHILAQRKTLKKEILPLFFLFTCLSINNFSKAYSHHHPLKLCRALFWKRKA